MPFFGNKANPAMRGVRALARKNRENFPRLVILFNVISEPAFAPEPAGNGKRIATGQKKARGKIPRAPASA
jgi:hypothetical protein